MLINKRKTKPQKFAEPGPGRCAACSWVDEVDSTKGKHFRGVKLCPLHAAAPDLLAAAAILLDCWNENATGDAKIAMAGLSYAVPSLRAAIAKARRPKV